MNVWSKISQDQYLEIQKMICDDIKADKENGEIYDSFSPSCGNLRYDFVHWGHRG